jgi:RNA polymerase sigma-54 factor
LNYCEVERIFVLFMLRQTLSQKLQQKLSPQQIQLMKLLQVPTAALEQRIKEELEENPALDEGPEASTEDEFGDEELNNNDSQEESGEQDFDLEELLGDDDYPYYKTKAEHNQEESHREIPMGGGPSFHEQLLAQIGLRDFNPEQAFLARFLIGNIDEDGYLMRELESMVNDLAFTQGIETTEEELQEVLSMVQEFDPAGIAARNLQECLLLQLRRRERPSAYTRIAIDVLENHYEAFTRKHYPKIQRKLSVDDETLKLAIREIIHCNPKPGGGAMSSQRAMLTIIPDFLLSIEDGIPSLTLNSRNAPELKVSRTYADMLRTYAEGKGKNVAKTEKEAMQFVRQKVESARWFIEAIKQRQETLLSVMAAIVEFQIEYFLSGDETKLRPMVLRDISETVGLDISTISRVANSKYIETPYGTFLLKSFFSEGISTESGEDASSREVKRILEDAIASEDKLKPLTDDQLTEVLAEKGYKLARRTVAKYREQLEIPVARLRKNLE